MHFFGRSKRDSMTGPREERSKSPGPPAENEWNLRRTNNPADERSHFPGSNHRQTNSTSSLSNDVQPIAPAVENSRNKSSGASSSSRRSKEERSRPSDECEEDEDGSGISLIDLGEPSGTEGKDQASGTDTKHRSRKVQYFPGTLGI